MVRKKNEQTVNPRSHTLLFFWKKRSTKSNKQKINARKKSKHPTKTRESKTNEKTKGNTLVRQWEATEKTENNGNNRGFFYLNQKQIMIKKQKQCHRSYRKKQNKRHLPRCLTTILNNPRSGLSHCVSDDQSWQTPRNNPPFTRPARRWIPRLRHCSLKTPLLCNLAFGIANMWNCALRTA